MAQPEGAGAGQRFLLADAARLQPWTGRIHRLELRPPGFTKATVTAWRVALEVRGLPPDLN